MQKQFGDLAANKFVRPLSAKIDFHFKITLFASVFAALAVGVISESWLGASIGFVGCAVILYIFYLVELTLYAIRRARPNRKMKCYNCSYKFLIQNETIIEISEGIFLIGASIDDGILYSIKCPNNGCEAVNFFGLDDKSIVQV